jgi:hypothetical protein
MQSSLRCQPSKRHWTCGRHPRPRKTGHAVPCRSFSLETNPGGRSRERDSGGLKPPRHEPKKRRCRTVRQCRPHLAPSAPSAVAGRAVRSPRCGAQCWQRLRRRAPRGRTTLRKGYGRPGGGEFAAELRPSHSAPPCSAQYREAGSAWFLQPVRALGLRYAQRRNASVTAPGSGESKSNWS